MKRLLFSIIFLTCAASFAAQPSPQEPKNVVFSSSRWFPKESTVNSLEILYEQKDAVERLNPSFTISPDKKYNEVASLFLSSAVTQAQATKSATTKTFTFSLRTTNPAQTAACTLTLTKENSSVHATLNVCGTSTEIEPLMLKFLTTTLLDTLFIAKHWGKALTLTSILGAVFGLPHLQEAQRRREAERQARERAQYLEQLAQERAHYLRQKENFIRELQLQELFKAAPHTTPYLTDREITSTMVSLDWRSRVIVGRWESDETTPGDETLILEKLMKEKEQQEPMQKRVIVLFCSTTKLLDSKKLDAWKAYLDAKGCFVNHHLVIVAHDATPKNECSISYLRLSADENLTDTAKAIAQKATWSSGDLERFNNRWIGTALKSITPKGAYHGMDRELNDPGHRWGKYAGYYLDHINNHTHSLKAVFAAPLCMFKELAVPDSMNKHGEMNVFIAHDATEDIPNLAPTEINIHEEHKKSILMPIRPKYFVIRPVWEKEGSLIIFEAGTTADSGNISREFVSLKEACAYLSALAEEQYATQRLQVVPEVYPIRGRRLVKCPNRPPYNPVKSTSEQTSEHKKKECKEVSTSDLRTALSGELKEELTSTDDTIEGKDFIIRIERLTEIPASQEMPTSDHEKPTLRLRIFQGARINPVAKNAKNKTKVSNKGLLGEYEEAFPHDEPSNSFVYGFNTRQDGTALYENFFYPESIRDYDLLSYTPLEALTFAMLDAIKAMREEKIA